MKIQLKLAAIFLFAVSLSFTGCSDDGNSLTLTTYAIGDTGPSGVGIVFYITDGGLHGLETAPSDQSTNATWSTITDAFANGSTALPPGIGTGSANTDAIIAQNGGAASAAKLCRDYAGGGLTDWFLPSKDELNAIWDNLVDDGGSDNSGAGDFADDGYWCSTEYNANPEYASIQLFDAGDQTATDKSSILYVRAVRAF